MTSTTVRVASEERYPGWMAGVGAELYRHGWRLRRPPPVRHPSRHWVVRVPVPAGGPCSARYALLLGAAGLDGRAVPPVPTAAKRCPRVISFYGPAEWRGPGLGRAIRLGLSMSWEGIADPPKPWVRLTARLSDWTICRLESLGGDRSAVIRLALAAIDRNVRKIDNTSLTPSP